WVSVYTRSLPTPRTSSAPLSVRRRHCYRNHSTSPKPEITMAKELLFSLTRKDFEVQTFRAGGKGGQHQNTTDSGVRITHPDSGAVGESRNHRSQHRNKKAAFERLMASPRFKTWHARKCREIMTGQPTPEQVVARQ